MRNVNVIYFFLFGGIGDLLFESTMKHPAVIKMLNSKQKFDLVIGEYFLIEGLVTGLAYKFNAPMVTMTTSMPFAAVNELVGNPAPLSFVADAMLGTSDRMNFGQRVLNFLLGTAGQFMFHTYQIYHQNKLMKQYFGDEMPHLRELVFNNSLILVNYHHSLAFPRPYNPNMIEIGGYHVRPPKPLPKDLQKFMDEAKNGVIYFSMGTNLPSADFPKEKFEGIIKALARLKQRVLWKFEKENTPNLPENIKISKWLPQTDILAHKNIVVFITHGGLLSVTEAVYRGVPIVGIPIYGDQPGNLKHIERMGVGVKLEYEDISEETLFKSIQQVLRNPEYTENAKKRSNFLRDRPLPPIDTAIFWLEYVMRHKGAPHLRSAALDLAWYQLYFLDVIAFIAIIVYIFMYILYKFFCFIAKSLRRGKKSVSKDDRKIK